MSTRHTPPGFAPPKRLSTILGASLETIFHELLYLRRIYPPHTFATNRYLGVRCHANRHPAVVDYVADALDVAVPAICGGVADEIALVVMDRSSGGNGDGEGGFEEVLERFVFRFDVDGMVEASDELGGGGRIDGGDDPKRSGGKLASLVRNVETSLRDVLLRVISLDGLDLGGGGEETRSSGRSRRRRRPRDGATFKLSLHVATAGAEKDAEVDASEDGKKTRRRRCDELERALGDGTWFNPDGGGGGNSGFGLEDSADTTREDRRRIPASFCRPLTSVAVPGCGLRMQLTMEVE